MTAIATRIISEARGLLESPPIHDPDLWNLAAALLSRQALEAAMAEFWEQHSPNVADASMHAQMLCLSAYLDGEGPTAGDAMQLWNVLSRVCHYDHNALIPSAPEVDNWLMRAARLCVALADPTGT